LVCSNLMVEPESGREYYIGHAKESVCGVSEPSQVVDGERDKCIVLFRDCCNCVELCGCCCCSALVFVGTILKVWKYSTPTYSMYPVQLVVRLG
jgi:hypothetical protein